MTDTDDCERDMFVDIQWEDDVLAIPLAQLEPVDVDDEGSLQAIEDWAYWVERGYEF